jgi:hypothetical protein
MYRGPTKYGVSKSNVFVTMVYNYKKQKWRWWHALLICVNEKLHGAFGIEIQCFVHRPLCVHIVTCRPIARKWVDKHVSMEMNSLKPTCYGTRFRGHEWSKNISLDMETLYKRRTEYRSDQ